MPPRVSVILPAFNAANYLKQAIDSLLNQTCDAFEIILVNDGSTDGGATRAIAESYGDRLRYIEQQNQGVGGALNTGVSAMQGDFFAWLSHDDLYLPQRLERQLAAYDRLGRDDIILYSNYGLIDSDGNFIASVRMDRIVSSSPGLALLRGCVNGCTVFVPRRAFAEVGLFRAELKYTQDYELWNRMRRHYDFVLQPEMLVLTRQHAEQFSNHPQAVREGDILWRTIIDSHSPVEQAMISGSSYRFLSEMDHFLRATPYQEAAKYAGDIAKKSIKSTLVSVIIPFFNDAGPAARALKSVLAQTHAALEVIVVNDGSTEDDQALRAIAAEDGRARIVYQENGGPGSARNFGMKLAKGDYIAFLDSDDIFLPHKIETQLRLMQEKGSLISHTSYSVIYPDQHSAKRETVHSGRSTGNLFPWIICTCPIATPSVMMHRALATAGFRFPETVRLGEDTIFWIQIAREHEFLGIDEPLTVVERSPQSAAIDIRSSLAGLKNIKEFVTGLNDPPERQIAQLNKNIAIYERLIALGASVHSLKDPTPMTYYIRRTLNRFPRVKQLTKRLLRGDSMVSAQTDAADVGKIISLDRDGMAKEIERLHAELAATKLERDALKLRYLRAIAQADAGSTHGPGNSSAKPHA